MTENELLVNEKLANDLLEAIKKLTAYNNFDALNNFHFYLSNHFKEWFEKHATSPENLVHEFQIFANMFDDMEE